MTSLFGILIMAVFGGFFHFLHAKKTLKTLQFQFFEKSKKKSSRRPLCRVVATSGSKIRGRYGGEKCRQHPKMVG
jgi:hypothetical protein